RGRAEPSTGPAHTKRKKGNPAPPTSRTSWASAENTPSRSWSTSTPSASPCARASAAYCAADRLTWHSRACTVRGLQEKERSLAMFGLGYQELLLILVIVLILFGAQRLPDLARSLGSSVKEFKKGVTELKDDTSPTQKKDDDKKV